MATDLSKAWVAARQNVCQSGMPHSRGLSWAEKDWIKYDVTGAGYSRCMTCDVSCQIACLFFDGSKMDISVYACGILCMNMLQDRRLVIDYARHRMAVLSADTPLPSV